MKKDEFMRQLSHELQKRGIKDVQEIEAEYREHFAFKEADGVSEEEAAAQLGDPAVLAAQFASEPARSPGKLRRAGAYAGLGALGVVMWLLLAVLWAGVVALLLVSLSGVLGGAILALGGAAAGLPAFPYMPAASALLFGLALVFFGLFLCLVWRYALSGCVRLQRAAVCRLKNAFAAAGGRPGLAPSARRPGSAAGSRLRKRLMWIFLAAFALFVAAAMVVSVKSAGGLPFWHIWGWFGYDGPLKGI